jgi:hypothetical protein
MQTEYRTHSQTVHCPLLLSVATKHLSLGNMLIYTSVFVAAETCFVLSWFLGIHLHINVC